MYIYIWDIYIYMIYIYTLNHRTFCIPHFSIFCIDMEIMTVLCNKLCARNWSLGCMTAPKPAGTCTSPSQSAPTRTTLFSSAHFLRMFWNTVDWWLGARSHRAMHGASAAFSNPKEIRLRRISWVMISKNFTHTSPFHMWLRLLVCKMWRVPAYSLFMCCMSLSVTWPSPKVITAGPSSPSAHEIVVVVRGARHPWHVTEVPYAPSSVSFLSQEALLSLNSTRLTRSMRAKL